MAPTQSRWEQMARELILKRGGCCEGLCTFIDERSCGCFKDAMAYAASIAKQVREEDARVAERAGQIQDNPIGPLYGAGWTAASEYIAQQVRSLVTAERLQDDTCPPRRSDCAGTGGEVGSLRSATAHLIRSREDQGS